ncbi:MAG: acylphosphatase [Xanthomonadales bacterium]|nr:acylphosphatase [Xanthomonadales bacterium]
MPARRFLISGRVQGVFFRESTRKEAGRLGVAGYAVNLPDGRVEVAAKGDEGALGKLQQWLRQGPPMARVDNVEVQPGPEDFSPEGFETGWKD